MKKIVLLAMGMVMGMTAFAQDDGEYRSSEIETTISGDADTRRGIQRTLIVRLG